MTATKNVEASRWLAWAAVLAGRFAVRSRLRRGLPLELLRRRTSVVMRRMAWHPTIAVNVSLSHGDTWVVPHPREREAMTLGSPWPAKSAADGPVRTSAPLWGSQAATVASGRGWPVGRGLLRTRPIDDQVVHALIKRVVARIDRVERRATNRDLVLAAPAAAAPPVRAVAAPELLPASLAPHARVSSGPWSGREPSPPALNVDRIADHVLQQLDRRVDAWRERMGRA
jgi:hypothetical protein